MTIPHRYLFVGGLHRSGTSLTARLAATVPGVAGIEDAPVPENEGVYLQGAIPHDALAGRPMHFATDPDQHLTEAHPLNRLDTRDRLAADWDPWFAPAPWRVEKSPVNLTRMRLLQQLFPLSQFVVVLRHPEAVAAAVAKWVDATATASIDHWLEAHERVQADLRHLHSAMVLRYEDVVADPARARAALAAFLSSPPADAPLGEAVRDGNADYDGAHVMDPLQSRRAGAWGYGPGLAVDEAWRPPVRHPLRAVRERVTAAWGGPARQV
ncbi:sulfotransferase family protein [Jannaschia sp. LMIT008]|uniref:sulfotransferase family protein n=1 Tax=Jannaschia maritima TaxID=3032585 RepID=UPI002811ADCC|nr:sulfotransferase [Jannaschia sp. LMIT008]